MSTRMRAVTVHQIPELVNASVERGFIRDLQKFVEIERPRLVLDCSQVQVMDDAAIHLLLSCLEEGMKRNGDVKLAALSETAEVALRSAGVIRLFETYSSTGAAVHSFQARFSSEAMASMLAGEESAAVAAENEENAA